MNIENNMFPPITLMLLLVIELGFRIVLSHKIQGHTLLKVISLTNSNYS